MKLAILLATILTASAEVKTVDRAYIEHGTNYLARFAFDNSVSTTPATNPAGKDHYACKFNLYRFIPDAGNYIEIARDVPGVYTENGCFEDSLESLFYAVTKQQGNQAENDVKTVGLAIHAAPVVTNSVMTNVAYLKWSVRVPSKMFPTNDGYFITDWLLESQWLNDPGTNGSGIYYDTNVLSSNLVAKIVYPGTSNVMTLESFPIKTNVYKWHWGKVYGE